MEPDSVKLARYEFLVCGGWEVLQNPKYWVGVSRFGEAVDAAMLDVALDASQRRAAKKDSRP